MPRAACVQDLLANGKPPKLHMPWIPQEPVRPTFLCQRLSHPLALIFCEERLSDGSYRDLSETHSKPGMNRFVVLLCTGEWGDYLEALKLGAAEVVRCPLQPPDIDMVLIHAMRRGRESEAIHASA